MGAEKVFIPLEAFLSGKSRNAANELTARLKPHAFKASIFSRL
jgi:hypothetical protein